MYKAILAAAAAAALLVPAAAHEIDMNGRSPLDQPPQAEPAPMPGSSQATTGRAVSPEFLSAAQIRDIQQALGARGGHVMRTDGQWGADIEAAIRDFQKSENLLSQSGELDPMTLMALGLNPLSFGLPGASETFGQATPDKAAPHERTQDVPELPIHERPVGGEEDR